MHLLSDRQREIAIALAHAASTDEVARTLSISLTTMRTHVRRIYKKLKIHNRTQLVLHVFKHLEDTQPLPAQS